MLTKDEAERLKNDLCRKLTIGACDLATIYTAINYHTEPDPKPEFKVGDYIVCDTTRHYNVICEITSIEQVDYPVYTCTPVIRNDIVSVKCTRLDLRHATDSDWIVEEDGIRWRAEESLNPLLNPTIRLYISGNDCDWYEYSGIGDYPTNNKAMKQICYALNIPIKPLKGD